MHRQLSAIVLELQRAQSRLHRLVDGLTADQWIRRPDPKRWSVAECVEHLNLTSRAFIPLLEQGIADARRLGEPAPARYRRDALGWLLWKTMPPPVRLRMPTAAAFVPDAHRPPSELLGEFDRLQAALIRLTASADTLPIHRVRVPSPFTARASYNLFSALSILPPHQERHIWQAERTTVPAPGATSTAGSTEPPSDGPGRRAP